MTAQELATRRYIECAYVDETTTGQRCYIAHSPEVVHCFGQGATLAEAIADLRLARIDLFQSLIDDGLPVPEPKAFSDEAINVNLWQPWGYGTVTL